MTCLGLFVACSSDHSALEQRDWDAGGSSAGGGGGTGGASSGGSAGASDAGPDAPVEPAGDYVFRLLHGAVDAERVSICFRVVLESGETAWIGSPMPAAGLAYGELLDLSGLQWQPATQGLQPVVFAGDLSLVSSLDCASAVAKAKQIEAPSGDTGGAGGTGGSSGGSGAGGGSGGGGAGGGSGGGGKGGAGGTGGAGGSSGSAGSPADAGPDASLDASAGSAGQAADAATDAGPDAQAHDAGPDAALPSALRVRELAVIPAASLREDRSYLMVLVGCAGGVGFSDPSERSVCGPDYQSSLPSLSNLVVEVSRITSPTTTGVQFLNASVAAGEVGLTSQPAEGAVGSLIEIAARVPFGRIAPRPPRLEYSAASYGLPLTAVQLLVTSYGATTPGVAATWSEALPQGSSIANGHNFLVVSIGPAPGFVQAGWWQPARLVALPSDP